jgi:hypothetical protein
MHASTAARRAFIALLLLCAAIVPLGAIPASFVDDSDGWLNFTAAISWGLGDALPTAGLEMSGCGPERIGFGFGSLFGPKGFFVYLEGIYFWDPVPSELLTVPIKLRLGGSIGGIVDGDISAGFGASLLAGCQIFPLMLRYDEDEEEDLGIDIGAYAALNLWNGAFFPSVLADLGFALGLTPDTGGGYYYYY